MDTLFSNPALFLAIGAVVVMVMFAWQRAERAERAERQHSSQRRGRR